MSKLIHVAKLYQGRRPQLLYLRQISEKEYQWFQDTPEGEKETPVKAATIEEAMRLAVKYWKNDSFKTLICGFKFTLPERDEHGYNALFYEMGNALGTLNGVYFDDELGHLCQIRQIPREAKDLYKTLKSQNKI